MTTRKVTDDEVVSFLVEAIQDRETPFVERLAFVELYTGRLRKVIESETNVISMSAWRRRRRAR